MGDEPAHQLWNSHSGRLAQFRHYQNGKRHKSKTLPQEVLFDGDHVDAMQFYINDKPVMHTEEEMSKIVKSLSYKFRNHFLYNRDETGNLYFDVKSGTFFHI